MQDQEGLLNHSTQKTKATAEGFIKVFVNSKPKPKYLEIGDFL